MNQHTYLLCFTVWFMNHEANCKNVVRAHPYSMTLQLGAEEQEPFGCCPSTHASKHAQGSSTCEQRGNKLKSNHIQHLLAI